MSDEDPTIAAGAMPSAPPLERREIRHLVCRRCGCSIEGGLCGWECDLDNTPSTARQHDDMEIRVYQFVRTEALLAPVGGRRGRQQKDKKHEDNQTRVDTPGNATDSRTASTERR